MMLSVSSPLASAAERGAPRCRLRTTLLPRASSQVVKPAQAGALTTPPLPESCRAPRGLRRGRSGAQPPGAEKLHVHPLRAICVVVQDNQRLIQLLHLQLLGCLGDLALPLDDAPQRCLVPLVVVSLLPFTPRSSSMYFLTGIQLSSMFGRGRCLCMEPGAPRTGSEGVFSCGKELDLPHSFAFTSQIRRSALSEFSGIKLKAGMRLKYVGSKSWLAPRMDRLLGDVACFTLLSLAPESWSTTLPPGVRPGGAWCRRL